MATNSLDGGVPSLPAPSLPKVSQSGYTPKQWSKPAMVSVTVPAARNSHTPTTQPSSTSTDGTYTLQAPTVTAQTTYVFDAVLGLDHDQSITKTRHPVQTGSAISSHAYLEPAQVVLYVLMSDVAGSYTGGVNQTKPPYVQAWTGNPSKSVSAYQTMLNIQAQRILLTVTTRLRTYKNMLIMRVSPREDEKTIAGARFRIEFEQIFIANTQLSTVSARPNDTAATGLGAVNVQPPTQAVQNQFGILGIDASADTSQNDMAAWLQSNPNGVNVPGAGSYSSTNVNSLQQLPSPS